MLPMSAAEVPSTCTPSYQGDIHVLRVWPHMHQYGTRFLSEIVRTDGRRHQLVEVNPWVFADQVTYDRTTTIHPGAVVTSTCWFQNNTPLLVGFGESSEAEMCYNFAWAYPARTLVSAGSVHRNQCLL